MCNEEWDTLISFYNKEGGLCGVEDVASDGKVSIFLAKMREKYPSAKEQKDASFVANRITPNVLRHEVCVFDVIRCLFLTVKSALKKSSEMSVALLAQRKHQFPPKSLLKRQCRNGSYEKIWDSA